MNSLRYLTAAAVAAATLTAVALAAPRVVAARSLWQQADSLKSAISWHRSRTWHYQDRAGVARTRTVYAERRTRSVPFLRWVDHLWSQRQARAQHLLTSKRLPGATDWQTSVRIVQRTWPGTATWLLSTSSGEGGWGGCVWNGGAPCSSANHGSGAAGWLQYMSSTFYSHLRSALAEARAEHRPTIPASARTWFSPLGQAFAGGWGCHHNASAWSRPSC